jgi:rfaE bifunctional protein kinase chain/domain
MKLDFSDIKVLLIGDFMIDHYTVGRSTRMSPEAPVPIVTETQEYSKPGGAGNVAMNLSSMGANITCIGAVGNDIWGQKLIEILNSNNINTKYIELIKDYTTTLKQRVYSNGIQIARVDQEEYLDWNPNLSENFDYADYDVIILSDYSKGVLIRPWFFEPKGIDVILDPKNKKWKHLFKHSNIITPNLNELKKISGMNITDNHSILNACNQLIKDNNFDYIIAKKGNQGMTIVGKDNFVKHIEAHYVENPDVTGAGDTVIAVLSIVYAKTNDIEFSAKFANAAASIVVGKLGTATTTVEEIKKLLLK